MVKSLHRLLLQQHFEAKRLKGNTVADEMLAHGLNPVQTQRMQHGAGTLHDTQDGDGEGEPKVKYDDHHDGAGDAGLRKGVLHGHLPEDNGEALVSEGEGPEAEVRGGMRHAVETEFYFLHVRLVVFLV